MCEVEKMSEQAIFDRIVKIIQTGMSLKDITVTMDSDLIKDLGADSVDLVGSVMTIEDEFGIAIPDEDLEGIKTVGDVVRVVAKNL